MSHCDKDRPEPADPLSLFACCETFRLARSKWDRPHNGCKPRISYLRTYFGEPLGFFIEACDDDCADYPIAFCPWCGTKLPEFEVHDAEQEAEASESDPRTVSRNAP